MFALQRVRRGNFGQQEPRNRRESSDSCTEILLGWLAASSRMMSCLSFNFMLLIVTFYKFSRLKKSCCISSRPSVI